MEHQKCPICGERLVKGKDALISHIDKVHATDIPPKMSGGEYAYLVTHNNKPRKCMMCSNSTEWNLGTNKYNAFCSEACKAAYVKLARARLKKVYGKENLLDDPDQQKKMLANRSISGIYHHTDGGKITYTGSYEEDFVRMLDTFLSIPSKDIIMPSPHVYEYMYKGEKKFYFPDAFIPSINLEVEIKDGGSNPNMHHKIQDVDKVKERSKDEVLCKQNIYHYIKIEDKNYKSFFALITKLANNDITPMEEKRKIKVVPEGGRGAISVMEHEHREDDSDKLAAEIDDAFNTEEDMVMESLARPTKHNLQEIMRYAVGTCNSAIMDMNASDRARYAKGHIFKNESRSDALKFAKGEEVFVIKWDSTPYIKGMGGTSHQVLNAAKSSVETFHGKSVSLRVAKVEGQDILFATKNMKFKGDE